MKNHLPIFFIVLFLFSIQWSCKKNGSPVEAINKPPAAPSTPTPVWDARTVSTTPTLTWSCSDPDNDPLMYDIYFGIDNPPAANGGFVLVSVLG